MAIAELGQPWGKLCLSIYQQVVCLTGEKQDARNIEAEIPSTICVLLEYHLLSLTPLPPSLPASLPPSPAVL